MAYHAVAVQNPLTLAGRRNGLDEKKLEYVAAYAPEVGQSAKRCQCSVWLDRGAEAVRVHREKFAKLTSEGMLENVTEGLPMAERELALAVQGQSYGPMFDEKLTVAAWKTEPSWFVVSANDRMLHPQ